MLHPQQRLRLLRLVVVVALVGYGCTGTQDRPQPVPPPLQWESGTFSHPPLRGTGDLVTYVDLWAHPQSYTALTAARAPQVGAMFDAIDTAITAMLGGDLSVNWCAAVDAAGTAGYLLGRYYDTASSRWFLVGEDGSGTGQAYFIINPEPRRDLIVEAPHVYNTNAKLEGRTDTEGVHILRQTLGRALLINGADRCQGKDGGCGGTFSSDNVCPPLATGTRTGSRTSGTTPTTLSTSCTRNSTTSRRVRGSSSSTGTTIPASRAAGCPCRMAEPPRTPRALPPSL